MTETRVPMATAPDPAASITELQAQIDDLTATLEAHQRMFELLRASGLLPQHDDGRRQ